MIKGIYTVYKCEVNWLKRTDIKENKIWIEVGIIILLLVNTKGLNQMKVPTILHDEIGYWTDAAYFAGYRWTGITQVFSYYSYGIGIIFSIFIRLFRDMIQVYRAVMGLNILLMIMMFIIAYKICSILFENVPCLIKVIAVVGSLCYPTYMMNIGIAWAEYYILFIIWLNVFIFVSLLKRQNFLKIIFYAISLCYLYMIHQRNIVALSVGILIISYLVFKKKISIKNYLLFLSVIVFMIIIHKYIKVHIIGELWLNNSTSEVSASDNDYSGRINNMIYAFRNAGIITFFKSALGKIYYLIVASGGMYIGGVVNGCRAMKHFIKGREENVRNLAIIYINLIVVGMIGLCSISTMADGITPSRIDSLIYGRYIECVIGPLLMVGFIEFYQYCYSNKICTYIWIFILGLALVIANIYRTDLFNDSFVISCAGGIARYFIQAGKDNFILYGALVTLCLLGMMFMAGRYMKKYYLVLSFCIICMVYIYNGNYLNKICRDKIQLQNQAILPLAQSICEIKEKVPIYCIHGEMPYAYMYLEVLQFLLPDYELSYIEDMNFDERNYFLLIEDINSVDMNKYVQISYVNMGWYVLVERNSDLYDRIKCNDVLFE